MSLNWGILATGTIARTLAAAVLKTPGNTLRAVASRSQAAADRFATDFGGIRAHGSYEALLADKDVDVIYVATPHTDHATWAIRALEAGKHVLCEKPAGLNHAEVMAMVHAARRSGRFFMEAFMYRCHPQTRMVKRLIDSGAIGEVRHIAANFGYRTAFAESSRLFSNALAGGGILDVGCYPVSLARLVTGAEPMSVHGTGHLGSTGVDEWASALLGFSGGVSAQVATATRVNLDNSARISGTSGFIHLPSPWLPVDKEGNWSFSLTTQSGTDVIHGGNKPLYTFEVEAVARAIGRGDCECADMNWQDSLGNARVLDSWRASIGLEYIAEKAPTHRGPLVPLRTMPQGTPAAAGTIRRAGVPGLDKPVSSLVMGCDNQPNASHAAVMWDHFFEQGGNTFDTGFVYGNGLMEQFLGHWHRQRGVREEMVIIGKGAHTPHCYPEYVAQQLDISLDRMQTDQVDIYFLHRDNTDIPVGEFIDALNAEVARGRIRVFGGSNWTLARTREANAWAASHGKQGFSAISNNFSLARMVNRIWPGTEASSTPEWREYLAGSQLALMPWSSQARGFFTHWVDAVLAEQGKRGSGLTRVEPTVEELRHTWFADDNFERRRRAFALANERGTSAINIALAWVLHQPFPVFPLVGPRNLDELDSCINALQIALSAEEHRWLDLQVDER
ncbi:MAG: oxidoreductase [Gammaproteobacteria bacterium]|nr:oxidoreductase [Gammaproteobacteria bacterium]